MLLFENLDAFMMAFLGSSSSRITGLSAYGQDTACYSNGEQMRIPRVPWVSPARLSNLDCFGPIRLPLMSRAGLSRSWHGSLSIPVTSRRDSPAQNRTQDLFDQW
jgi:hypothetical protein